MRGSNNSHKGVPRDADCAVKPTCARPKPSGQAKRDAARRLRQGLKQRDRLVTETAFEETPREDTAEPRRSTSAMSV